MLVPGDAFMAEEGGREGGREGGSHNISAGGEYTEIICVGKEGLNRNKKHSHLHQYCNGAFRKKRHGFWQFLNRPQFGLKLSFCFRLPGCQNDRILREK